MPIFYKTLQKDFVWHAREDLSSSSDKWEGSALVFFSIGCEIQTFFPIFSVYFDFEDIKTPLLRPAWPYALQSAMYVDGWMGLDGVRC